MNELVKRFARGEQLSTEGFRQENEGWAFRAGPLRFYGCWSQACPGCFVLSHPHLKDKRKLARGDVRRMLAHRDEFDMLAPLTLRRANHELH